MGLKIKKLTSKAWVHIDDITGRYVLTNFYAREEFGKFVIIEAYGSQRTSYAINEIEVYDIGGSAETFNNFDQLETRLSNLSYQGFAKDGAFLEAPEDGKTYGRKDAAWVEVQQTSLRTQTFSLTRDWVTNTLDRMYYISFSNNALEFRPVGVNNTVIDSLTGRNAGMFVAPYDCKITSVSFLSRNTGSYIGVFGIGSGKLDTTITANLINQTVHLNTAITSSGFFTNEYNFDIVSGATITKGDVVCPCLLFSSQAQTAKNGITIQINIEEVI